MKRKEKGLTTIEVLISIAVLGVGLITLVALQLSSIKQNAFAHRVGLASSLAQEKAEELRWQYARYFSSDFLTSTPTCTFGLQAEICDANRPAELNGFAVYCGEQQSQYGQVFTMCWAITPSTTPSKSPPFDIGVYAVWSDKSGAQYTRRVDYRTKYDPRVASVQ